MSLTETALFDTIARSNVNSVWGAFTVEVLARLGVEMIVTSPGSRSTPLTIAAARNARVEALSILDERSAAFYALGQAKRRHRPVALVCTSGSAAANYWPAVVEASMSGTPLLLLTADRPPELRDCSSGQTIDQLKLYGGYVRHFAELALPECSPAMLAYLRQTLVHAVNASLAANAGPVHLNFPFRDPLPPSAVNLNSAGVVEAATLEIAATVTTRPCESVNTGGRLDWVALERLASHSKGLIVVGTENPRGGDQSFADAVTMISDKLGWPVVADVLNPLRHHLGGKSSLITRYDTFLRDEALASDIQPTAILQIGTLPTSKVLRAWLGSLDATSFLLTAHSINTDPLHRVATPMHGDVHELAEHLSQQRLEVEWAAQWARIEQLTADALEQELEPMDALFEGKVAWLLSKHLPIGSAVFLASSMSVRYAEYFWAASRGEYAIYCNRGANGIDGTLSTALGMAHGAHQPCVLLTGDLAFLHDSNGLLAAGQLKGSLTVILINNNGGGIFEHLPVSQMDPPFEAYFSTPQHVDIAQLCAAHGVSHQVIADWAQFVDVLLTESAGLRVLELQTDRKADRAQLLGLISPEAR